MAGSMGGLGETESLMGAVAAQLDRWLPWVLVAWCVGGFCSFFSYISGLVLARRIKVGGYANRVY